MYRVLDYADQLKVMMSQDNKYVMVTMIPSVGAQLFCNYEVFDKSLRGIQYLSACENGDGGVLDRASWIDRFEVIPHRGESHVYVDGSLVPLVYLGRCHRDVTSEVRYDVEIFATGNILYSIPKRSSDMIRSNHPAINTMVCMLSLWRVACGRLNVPDDVSWVIVSQCCELFRALDYSRYCVEVQL